MKAAKEPKADADSDPTADEESEAEAKTESATASSSQTAAADLEEELLQSPPKRSADKLRVLRSRLKRLNNKIKEDPQVLFVSPKFERKKKEKSQPLGVMTGAYVPRSSPNL